jgi:UPF0755 protein
MTEPSLPSPVPVRSSVTGWAFWGRVLFWVVVASLAATGEFSYYILYKPNVPAAAEGAAYLYIRPGAEVDDVMDSLRLPGQLERPLEFIGLARVLGYGSKAHPVHAGRYTLAAGLGNLDLLHLLESGRQDTLTFTLKPFHYLPQLPRQAGRQLWLDTTQLHKLLTNNAYLVKRYGLDTATVRALFIPGRYGCFGPRRPPRFLIRWPPGTAASGRLRGCSRRIL